MYNSACFPSLIPSLFTSSLFTPPLRPLDPCLGEFILTGDNLKLPAVCKTIYSVNGKYAITYYDTIY